jgi:dTDP-4-amino-4,6-dideoxygalactose transaminase
VIPLYKPHIPRGAAEAIDRVLQSGQIAGDGHLPAFEGRFREFIGAPYVAATAEFSRSLEMALRMAGVGPGDSVILSPLACLATTMPLVQVGARPVWCVIDPLTGSLDSAAVAASYHSGVKAVLQYHWVGIPGDIDGLLRVTRELGVPMIEDAGESLGAEYGGKRIGSHGSAYTVFSFSAVRHITTGEGAAIALRDEAAYQRARAWRRYGIPAVGFRDAVGEINEACDIALPGGHNFMSRIAEALALLQMDCLPDIVSRCRDNGAFYDRALAGIAGLRVLPRAAGTVPSYWVYCLRAERRDDLLRKLRSAGIYASMVHARNDGYSVFAGHARDLPGVDTFAREQISIPCGWWVRSEDRERIAETIRGGW